MRVSLAFVLVALFLFAGCSTGSGSYPHASGTKVDLSKGNYKVVAKNAVGTSSGFRLLGIIPFASPRHSDAMEELWEDSGQEEGGALALANVTQDESTLYLILFSIPKVTIRADVIEFTD